jgi:hypothetical protein
VRQDRMRTRQVQPLALRLGIETPGLMKDRQDEHPGS